MPSTDLIPISEDNNKNQNRSPACPPVIQIREALQKKGILGTNGLLKPGFGGTSTHSKSRPAACHLRKKFADYQQTGNNHPLTSTERAGQARLRAYALKLLRVSISSCEAALRHLQAIWMFIF